CPTNNREYQTLSHEDSPSSSGAAGYLLLSTAYESVPNTNNCFDATATLIQFLSQPAYVYVECTRIAVITIPPNAIEELLSRHHAIRTFCQHGQKRELLVGQLNLSSIANNSNVVEVDQQMVVLIAPAHG